MMIVMMMMVGGERQQRSDHRWTGIGWSVVRFRGECFEATEVLDARTGAGEVLALRGAGGLAWTGRVGDDVHQTVIAVSIYRFCLFSIKYS